MNRQTKLVLDPIFRKELIAPCGMNCGVCIAYLREKKPCSGCRMVSENKPQHCVSCIIVNCNKLSETDSGFCMDCEQFPCPRMKRLDARYRKNYKTSLIVNQKKIKLVGIEAFLQNESLKWSCPYCGTILSIHRDCCLICKEPIKMEE